MIFPIPTIEIPDPPTLTVTELNKKVRLWLERDIGTVCVEGELSNFTKPVSGHIYFTLKDKNAQIKCVFFKNRHLLKHKDLKNGQQVVLSGNLSLYEARGDYQLIVSTVDIKGVGDLFRKFEELKKKLQALGLFALDQKKSIPQFPKTIGIITSKTAAALQDILATLKKRYPVADIIIYPCEVQGSMAHEQIINAIRYANIDNRSDVIILARGGGSMEDLFTFNMEKLAYAIFESKLPIVSGIGHEIDFTIADFVADIRATTPTGAAEIVTPDKADLLVHIQNNKIKLQRCMMQLLQQKQLLLKHELQKIASPDKLIQKHWQSLDYLSLHLKKSINYEIACKKHNLSILQAKLSSQNPAVTLKNTKSTLESLQQQLINQIKFNLYKLKTRLNNLIATLNAISPLKTLDRGYAIVTHKNHVILDPDKLEINDILDIRLAKGNIESKITNKKYDNV